MEIAKHEINDLLTSKQKKALALREAGYTFKKMGEVLNVSPTAASRWYGSARRNQEAWIEFNKQRDGLLFQLLPIINSIKELEGK